MKDFFFCVYKELILQATCKNKKLIKEEPNTRP